MQGVRRVCSFTARHYLFIGQGLGIAKAGFFRKLDRVSKSVLVLRVTSLEFKEPLQQLLQIWYPPVPAAACPDAAVVQRAAAISRKLVTRSSRIASTTGARF